MDVLSSAEFRKTYAKLMKPVIVTVNGHPIGVWSPRSLSPDGVHVSPVDEDELQRERELRRPLTQADRDAILRRVNKGG